MTFGVSELARRLDDLEPDWAKMIDLETLDLNDTRHCVIGQALSHGSGICYFENVRRVLGDGSGWTMFSETYRPGWLREINARRN